MDNLKALVERLDAETWKASSFAGNRRAVSIEYAKELVAALSPLAEPVEMPEEPIVLWYPMPGGGDQMPVISADAYRRLRAALERANRHIKLRDSIIKAHEERAAAGNK